jgi:hypothetical protein
MRLCGHKQYEQAASHSEQNSPATRQPDHSSARKLRHPHALLLDETKEDLILTRHTCRKPAFDALVS